MTGADLQWWHFAIALATILLPASMVVAWQEAKAKAVRDRRINGFIDAGLTEAEACALVDDLP